MHEIEGDLTPVKRDRDGGPVGDVNCPSCGARDLGSATRDRDDVVLGLDKSNRQLPPDEPVCSHHRDSHASTMHQDRSAVDDVELDGIRGELLAVMGPIGCVKLLVETGDPGGDRVGDDCRLVNAAVGGPGHDRQLYVMTSIGQGLCEVAAAA